MGTLKELYEAMKRMDPATLDKHGQWRSDLPTFSSDAPSDTQKVWSWSATQMIVGTCADDLEIVARP